jgi:uncharacterized protein (DUF427 family)
MQLAARPSALKDVIVDGERHKRAAWQYERPRPEMAQVSGRFGFWQDVEVG